MAKRKRSRGSNSQSAEQSRSWREFELLVSRIEEALVPRNAIVKSPDKLYDRITNEPREVDVSIRYKVGSAEILIILECRERTRVQDTIWIEQLASKQKAVGAAKCIAVSSVGFTRPAQRKAQALGIELRIVSKVDNATILKWAPFRTCFYEYKFKWIDFTFAHDGVIELNQQLDNVINKELQTTTSLDAEVLLDKSNKQNISIGDYARSVIDTGMGEIPSEKVSDLKLNTPIVFSLAGDPEYYIAYSKGIVDIIGAAVCVEFIWITDYSTNTTERFEYSDGDKTIVEGWEFGIKASDGTNSQFGFYKDVLTGQFITKADVGAEKWLKHFDKLLTKKKPEKGTA